MKDVEHLVRGNNSCNDYWKSSANQTHSVDKEQFLNVRVNSDWNGESFWQPYKYTLSFEEFNGNWQCISQDGTMKLRFVISN